MKILKKIVLLSFVIFVLVSCTNNTNTETTSNFQPVKVKYNPEQRFVTDLEDLLTSEQERNLNNLLSEYEQKTTVEIAILTASDYEGYGDIGDYAVNVGESWGVGKKGVDNGVMIVVSKANTENFVATGYGIDGYLTDAFTHRMQDSLFIPNFKNNLYYEGLTAYVNSCMNKIGTEYSADTNKSSRDSNALGDVWKWFLALPLWIKLLALGCYIALWFISPTLALYVTLLPLNIITKGSFGGGKFGGGGSRS